MAPNMTKTDKQFPVFSREADKDYLLARHIHFLGAHFFDRAGFFAQMACEKYLKALTIQNSGTYADNTHNLPYLASLCEPYDAYFSEAETKRVLEQFDMFVQVGRYGGAAKFDPLSKGRSVGGVKATAGPGVEIAGLAMWSPKYLDDLDGFVFRVHSMLDYSKSTFANILKEILAGNPRAMLWNGPPPLRDVLSRENRFFRP